MLRAMGTPFTAAHGSVRFSFSVYNTDAEVDQVIEKMPGIIQKIRDISPFWHDFKMGRAISPLLTGEDAQHHHDH